MLMEEKYKLNIGAPLWSTGIYDKCLKSIIIEAIENAGS